MPRKLTTKEFVGRAREVHGERYDYSEVEYVNSKTKVKINCREHGQFAQSPAHHLQRRGCPHCGIESRRKTTKQFVSKANYVHGLGTYDYSEINYVGAFSKVTVICREHGPFEQLANAHIQGQGCPKCARRARRKTTEVFVTKAKMVHGTDQYDYSRTEYKGAHIHVTIICREHGPFQLRAANHVNLGRGCPLCAGNKPLTTETFIARANEVHGIDTYDYSLTEYVNAHTSVTIKCTEHGFFEQKPDKHLQDHGCPFCAGNQPMTTDEFILRANEIHGEGTYDYSQVVYTNTNTKVTIICQVHGPFEQLAGGHLSGRGCHACGGTQRLTTESFIAKAHDVHGVGTYDYSHVEYITSVVKVTIVCSVHGPFRQAPANHLSGAGCSRCAESHGERQVASVLDAGCVTYERERRFSGCRDRYTLPFDFYLPELNTCIEYHGRQHYEPVDIFGGEKAHAGTVRRDKIKERYCQQNGIHLIVIPYWEDDIAGRLRAELQIA